MDKRYLLTMAAAATVFAACSDDAKELNAPELATNPTEVTQQQDIPVLFDSYVNRATTRAGVAGDQVLTQLKSPWAPSATPATYGGFGVFAYYTDNNDYDQLATPNFFYNQLVKWDETTNSYWKYEPVRYWPNEYGSSAVSDDADRISFFAYAPYVEVNPSSGKLTANNNGGADESWGITGMSRNTASGDPIIKYIGSFDATKAVDLVWGVNNTATWQVVNGSTDQAFTAGLPWLNVERPAEANTQSAAAQRVKFQFMHALAKLQVNVNTFVDGTDNINGLADDNKTKIWIRSVRFKGFAMKGALNLNNETANKPYWMNYNGVGDLESDGEVIVYDGRKDGKEAMANAEASNEKVTGLNQQFIEDEHQLVMDGTTSKNIWDATAATKHAGVTKTETSLFENGGVFYVIPTDDQVEIEITYDVETIDYNLGTRLSDNTTPGSSIENCITKTISFGGTNGNRLEAGKAYVINLHLGMNSVKFDADVKAWEDVSPIDVNVPANVQFFQAGNPAATAAVTIPYNETDYQFGISGLSGGESITQTVGKNTTSETGAAEAESAASAGLTDWDVSNNNANTSGYSIQKVSSKANPTTTDRIQKWTWTGNQSANGIEMTFTQIAHPLFMAITSAVKNQKDIILTRYDDSSKTTITDWTNVHGWICDGTGAAITATDDTGNDYGVPAANKDTNYIKVWRNGAQLTWVTTPAATPTNFFTFTNAGTANFTAKITIGDTLEADDVIKVIIKTGDAPEETVTYTVPE